MDVTRISDEARALISLAALFQMPVVGLIYFARKLQQPVPETERKKALQSSYLNLNVSSIL
jgi:hypothetical protein